MDESAREFLERRIGVPISVHVDMELLARELSRLTMTERQERVRAEQETKNREAHERHEAIWSHLTPGTLRNVFDHHAPQLPRPGYIYSEPYCSGCDGKNYDNEPVDWPCSTWELIERAEKKETAGE